MNKQPVIKSVTNLFIANLQLDMHRACLILSRLFCWANRVLLWVCNQLMKDIRRRIDKLQQDINQ